MHIFNHNFDVDQSGAHPKGVQVTYLAIYSSLLGSIGLCSACYWLPQTLYVDPKV